MEIQVHICSWEVFGKYNLSASAMMQDVLDKKHPPLGVMISLQRVQIIIFDHNR